MADADIILAVASGIITVDGGSSAPLDPVAGQRLYLRYLFDTDPFERGEFDDLNSSPDIFLATNTLQSFELWIGGDGTTVSNDSVRVVDRTLTQVLVDDSPDGATTPREAIEVAYVAGFSGTPTSPSVIETRGFFSTLDYESSGQFQLAAGASFSIRENLFPSAFFPDGHALIDGVFPDAEHNIFFFTGGATANLIDVDQFSITTANAASVPEPSSIAFLGCILSFAYFRRREGRIA